MARAMLVLKNSGHRHGHRRMNPAARRKLSRHAKSRARNNRGQFMKSRNNRHRSNASKGRRHSIRRHVRHNGIALRSNGIALRSNGIGLRTNGLVGMGLAAIIPVLAGAGTLGLVHLGLCAVDWATQQLPATAQPYANTVLGYVEPVGYTAGAFAAASLAGLLSMLRVVPPKWAALFGSTAVIAGAAVDAFRWISSEPAAPPVIVTTAAAGTPAATQGWGDGGAWALGDGSVVHQISQASSAGRAAYASPTRSAMGAWMTAQR